MTRTLLVLVIAAAVIAGCSSPNSPVNNPNSGGGLVIVPHTINFGSAANGQPRDTSVELFDEGVDSVTIIGNGTSAGVTDSSFTHSISLAPDGSRMIMVAFAPSTQDTTGTDTLRYTESGKNYTSVLTLQATVSGGSNGGGSGSLFVPTAVDFGSLPIGSWHDTTVAIVNSGTTPVTILSSSVNSIEVQDTNFHIPSVLNPGSFLLIHLDFNPNASGLQAAADTIHYLTGGNMKTAIITMTATGISTSNTPGPGSTFTYDYSAVDTNGVTGPHSDSTYTVVSNTLDFAGKTSVIEVQSSAGSISYYHLEQNGDLAVYVDLSTIPLPIGVTSSWFVIPIGSKVPLSQTLFDSTVMYPYNGTTIPVAVSITSSAKDIGPTTVTAAGHSFACEKGSLSVTFSASAFGGFVTLASQQTTATISYSKVLKYYPERQDQTVNSGIALGNTTTSDTYLLKSYNEK